MIDTVQVVVDGPPVTVPPPVAPPTATPVEDRTGPRISRVRPLRVVRDATPTVKARVRDRDSGVRPRSVVLRLDGRRVRGVDLDARSGSLRWTRSRGSSPGATSYAWSRATPRATGR